MKTRQSYLGIVAAAAVLALPLAAAWLAGRPVAAPPVTFQTLSGRTVALAELRGQVVLVNFWASSCAVCVKEMPRLAATHRRHVGRGLATFAVAMSYDPPSYVVRFAERHALPFEVALDPVGAAAKGFGDVRLTPTTFLIDRQGRIVRRIVGEPDFDALDRLIETKLAEAA